MTQKIAKREAREREIERAQKQEEFRAQIEKTMEEFQEVVILNSLYSSFNKIKLSDLMVRPA
jgi:hypothetical protein